MFSRRLLSLFALLSLPLLATAACSGSSREGGFGDDDDTGSDAGNADVTVTPTPDSGPGISSGGSSSGGTASGPAEVFVHSAKTLYKLDPNTKAVTKVGDFHGVTGSVIDIALNASGDMFGTTSDALYKIDKATGDATQVGPGGADKYPNSLSFAPAGTVESDREVLVGYLDADYISIDPDTGATQKIGPNALGSDFVSSGDVVSIKGGDFLTYVTVKPANPDDCSGECAACKTNDCLFQIDPATGEKLSNLGTTNRPSVFGLAFWAGALYGINTDGKLFEINPESSPLSTGVKNISIPGSVSSDPIVFYGAGSTTSAPRGPN